MAVLAGLFALVNIVEIVAVDGRDLAGSAHLLAVLWTVHAAAFGLNLTAIAIALVGLSQAAAMVGLAEGTTGRCSRSRCSRRGPRRDP